jgi:archaemetzincin
LADHVRKRAVIALPRLREEFYGKSADEALFTARAEKEAIHELGHTYGLGHCEDRSCVMSFSNTLADTDYKRSQFCAQCIAQIQPESRAASAGA